MERRGLHSVRDLHVCRVLQTWIMGGFSSGKVTCIVSMDVAGVLLENVDRCYAFVSHGLLNNPW